VPSFEGKIDAVFEMPGCASMHSHCLSPSKSSFRDKYSATISQLKSALAKQETVGQQKQIEALTAALQKVSAQVELSKPAPRTGDNNQ
jgi:hypothetical protein